VTLFHNYFNQLGVVDPQLQDPATSVNPLEENRFVATFYNRFPLVYDPVQKQQVTSLRRGQIDFYKTHFPRSIEITKEVAEPIQPQEQQANQEPKLIKQAFKVPINLYLWQKAKEANPDPDTFHTVQINSTEELLKRCQILIGATEGQVSDSQHGVLTKAVHRLDQML